MTSQAPVDYELTKVILQAVGYAGTWGLIIAGWIVTSRHSLDRERRKELRSRVDSFISSIEEIEQSAIKFYQSEPGEESVDDKATKLWLLTAVGRLSRGLSRLNKAQKINAVSQIVRFRQAITSGDFASKNRRVRSDSDPDLHKITTTALELIERLESEYDRVHP